MTKAMLRSLIRRLSAPLSAMHATTNGSRRYSGRYHDGQAEYYYDESANGRIYNGPFRFSRSYRDYALGKVVETSDGQYADGLKEGRWTYTFKAHGIKRMLSVEYSGGKLMGRYTYKSVYHSTAATFNKGINTIRINTENNHPVNAIECVIDGESLTGSYDTEGRPDGKWTMKPVKHGGIKTYYETWEHGECTMSYVYDHSLGSKHEAKHFITELVASIIRRDCTPLERIVPKGSSTLSI